MRAMFSAVTFYALILSIGAGLCQQYSLEVLNLSVVEGQNVTYRVTVEYPALTNLSVQQTFIGPEGAMVILDPVAGVAPNSTHHWRTPFNKEGSWTLKVLVTGVDFENARFVSESLEAGFNVTKMMSERNPKYVILVLGAVTSLLTTVLSYLMIDQKRAKMVREKVSEFQKEMMAAQRSGDQKRIAKMRKRQSEMMALQSEMMKGQLKPMIIYMLPLFAVFYFLQSQYNLIPVIELPFRLGFMQFFHQNNAISPDQFGFIAWYFASATWFGSIFRKVLGVV